MNSTIDHKMQFLARSLQAQISPANELNLGFVVQLLTMAILEITTNCNRISEQELDALRLHLEENLASEAIQVTELTIGSQTQRRRRKVRRYQV
jgi:hypothetical protein